MKDGMVPIEKTTEHDSPEKFWRQLGDLFSLMDQNYQEVASHYGFACEGCEDNCCMTRFHHHTFLEVFYLKKAFASLEPETRSEIAKRAEEVVRLHAEAEKNGETARVMCPLNVGGKCLVYEGRPMICRLHGIPSELNPPGRPASAGPIITPGCDLFSRRCERMNYRKFDRTPFYMKLAALEREFKEWYGLEGKIKMTIAQILLCELQFPDKRGEMGEK